MKALICAVVLLVFAGLLLTGCSKLSQTPVSPMDQSLNQAGPLEKSVIKEFTGTITPIEVLGPGITKYPDGKMAMRGILQKVIWEVTFSDGGTDLVSGPGVLELNSNIDPAAGEAFWWGKLTLMPLASEAQGGQYQLTWHGKATLGPSGWLGGPGWTLDIQTRGHGEGGALDGIQCFFHLIVSAPPDISTWTGVSEGTIKTH
jgi:hypothetical protein